MDFRHGRNVIKLEFAVKERSLTMATGSNFNNGRIPFHQPDFTTSDLSNLAAGKLRVLRVIKTFVS